VALDGLKKGRTDAVRVAVVVLQSVVVTTIVLLLFLQKQSLAFAVYLFGIGTLHTGPGLKKNTCDNALTMTSPVHW
jgi:hypothetical protein